MSISDSDPRGFFAAERTLLAWLLTGLALIGLGLVVSRFGLFYQLLAIQSHPSVAPSFTCLSAVLGVMFVMTGTLAIFLSAIRNQRFIASLPPTDLPLTYSIVFPATHSFLVAALGSVLAIYLLFTLPCVA